MVVRQVLRVTGSRWAGDCVAEARRRSTTEVCTRTGAVLQVGIERMCTASDGGGSLLDTHEVPLRLGVSSTPDGFLSRTSTIAHA